MILPFGYTLKADFHGGFLLFLGMIVLLTIFIIFMNRRTVVSKGHLSRGYYALILGLRLVAMLTILLLVFNPEIVLKRSRQLPQRIAVIIDRSQSMMQAWEGDGQALIGSINNIISELEENQVLDLWSMHGDLLQREDITFEEDLSKFSWTPPVASSNTTENIYKAAVVISDGQLNRGRSPLDLKWSTSLPIFPVLPLNPRSNNSISITEVNYSEAQNSEEVTIIHAKMRQTGLLGKIGSVSVQNELGETLGEKEFRVDGVFLEASIPISLSRRSSHDLRVAMTLRDGGFRSESHVSIDYKQSKKKVLLVSEFPNELHKFLLQNFPDSSFQITSMLGTEIKAGVSRSDMEDIKALDLILLNEPGNEVLTVELEKGISFNLAEDCPLIVFHSGSNQLGSAWEGLLGTRSVRSKNTGERTVHWGDASHNHPFFLGLKGNGFSSGDMIKYSPIQIGENSLEYPGTKILEVGNMDGQDAALILADAPPRAIFNGSNYWRWLFQPQSKNSFLPFWQHLLSYLEDISNFQPIKINIQDRLAATGEYITANIVVKDINQKTIHASEMRVWQENGTDQQEALEIVRHESGEYQANLNTRQPGEFLVIAEAYRFGELWGRDTSRIDLIAYSEENQSTGVDEIFLERLAKHSGGKLIASIHDLPVLAEKKYTETTIYHFRGLHSLILFVILLTSLVLEWVIRRRSGLL